MNSEGNGASGQSTTSTTYTSASTTTSETTSSPEATTAASNTNTNNQGNDESTTTSSPTSSPNESSQNTSGGDGGGGMGVGVIVGIAVGAVAIILMIAAFVIWYRRTKRSSRNSGYSSSNGTTSNGKNLAPLPITHTVPMAVPVTGEYYDDITSVEILGRRSQMGPGANGNHTAVSWDDPEILSARIPVENLRVQQLINRGGFGEVFLGTYRGRAVAVKRLLPDRRRNKREIEAFLCEIKLMLSMDHPRIVGCLGVAWDEVTDLSVVSEYMEGGDLRSVLMRFDEEERPRGFDADKVKIALHVAEGMVYLHAQDPTVLHRDLKSKNILLNKNLDAKLTDFGVSRESADVTMTAGVGTSLWMAPEVMVGDRYNEKADMFSFGVVLSELDSQQLPYSNAKEPGTDRKLPSTAILQMVAAGQLRVEISEDAPKALRDLVLACTSLRPAERPTAKEALARLRAAIQEMPLISSNGRDFQDQDDSEEFSI